MKEILIGLGIIGGLILCTYLFRLIFGIIFVIIVNLFPSSIYVSHTHRNYMDYGIRALLILLMSGFTVIVAALLGNSVVK